MSAVEFMLIPIRKIFSRIQPLKVDASEARRLASDMETVRAHFDTDFYVRRNPDVAGTRLNPLEHFCQFGWREMRDPHPDFSVRYYLEENSDVRDQGINPYVHYLSIGRAQGRKSILQQSSGFGAAAAEGRIAMERHAIEQAFDRDFYLSRNPDVAASGADPLDHYLLLGWEEGRDPSPFFSTDFYLSTHPDVRSAGVNPFWHFIVAGEAEGRAAKPDALGEMSVSELSEYAAVKDALLTIESYFDAEFYLSRYQDVGESGLDPLVHFCIRGWKEGRDPSNEFSVSNYLRLHPDVAASGVNPFWHYIVAGREEGRLVKPPEDQGDSEANPEVSTEMMLVGQHFDSAYYLSKYVDVAEKGLDPLAHYWYTGWREGRDPSASFSTTFYLEANPDIADAGVNPFWHYIVAGKGEGRPAQHPGGYRVEVLRNLGTLEEQVLRWTHNRLPDKLLSDEDIADAVRKVRQKDSRRLLLSIGHDSYHRISGGVQLCEYREELLSGTTGCVYLSLHPWQPLPRLAHFEDDEDPILCLLANGEDLGQCRTSDLLRAVASLVSEFDDAQVVIHQLLGHMPEHIRGLISAAGRRECWFWLHDFLTICPSFTLQRNGVSYCGAPPLHSNACTLCRFGPERQTQTVRMRRFFDDIDVHILAPSQIAADIWQRRSGLKPVSLRVLPHMHLEWRKRSRPRRESSDRMTVAFLGTPAPHKGWNVFEALAREMWLSESYRFVFLGEGASPAAGIDHLSVHVTARDPDAMIRAVREERVDLVLHWASWPETFSLSTHEAYAGGAYVITNEASGNVAATVRSLARGAVLPDERALQAFFREGRASEMVDSLREERRRYDVRHHLSRLVHDAIDLSSAEAQR